MSDTPLHDFMLPHLERLVQDAEAAGFGRAPAVAVIMDIMMCPSFNTAPLPAEPVGEPAPAVPPVTGEHAAPSLGPTEWIQPQGHV